MEAYIITMMDNPMSFNAAKACMKSIETTKSNINAQMIAALIPDTIPLGTDIKWTWPRQPSENRYDMRSGLKLSAYDKGNITPRLACLLSHMLLWSKCIEDDETIMILEHDAIFNRKFDYKDVEEEFEGSILGLNNPLGVTRKSKEFYNAVYEGAGGVESSNTIMFIPTIDSHEIPQGLAGNSAYIIKPEGAKKLMKLIDIHGLWPNDALMCKQLMPLELQVVYPFYTTTQKTKSTTFV